MTTRIGLLGGSGIAVDAILWPVRRRDDVVVTAVASRSATSAYAAEHGIEHACDSYEEMLADRPLSAWIRGNVALLGDLHHAEAVFER